MELKGLIEQRNALFEKLEGIVQAASTENRALTDKENASYADTKKQLESLDATLCKVRELRGMQREKERNVKDSELTPEERSFVASIRNPSLRADTNTSTANAGVVIPKKVSDRIVEIVKNISPIVSMADTYRIKGQLVIPYEDGTSEISAVYADDFASIDATAQKLASVTLTGFTLRALAKVSRSLLNNSDIDLLNYVVNKVAIALAVKLEKEYLIGTASKISGIAKTATNIITAAAAAAITSDELIDVQEAVPDAYQANAIWIMHPQTRTAIRKLKDGDGNYLLQRDYTSKWNYMLLGKPVYASDNMPTPAAGAMTIYYGDMSGLASKISEELEVQVLFERFADQHAIGVVGFAEADAKIANAQKIAVLKMKAS